MAPSALTPAVSPAAGLLGPTATGVAAATVPAGDTPNGGATDPLTLPSGDPVPGAQVTAEVMGPSGGYSVIGAGRHVLVPGMQLLVLGTSGDDSITISQTGASITLTTPQGSTTYAGSFSWITVYGFGGHDTIRLAYSVTASATVYCGDDSSTVYDTGQGTDTVYGGAGDDTIISFGGGSSHRVFGGGGNNSLWIDGNTATPDVSAAEVSAGDVHQVQQFYQPYTTDSSSPDYVSMNINGQALTDPSASGTYVNYASHPLFTGSPKYADVRQGGLGDCYFVGSLAAVAESSRGAVSQMITSLGDGTYAVRFYSSTNNAAVYLRVDADLPTSGGSLVYAQFGPAGEMWGALAEKAYAFFRTGGNSYASLNTAGYTSTVLRQLTNQSTQTWYTGGPDQDMYNWIAFDLAAGKAVTLNSLGNASGPIIASHSYAVENAFTVNGTMFITMYNPWGYDGGNDSTSYNTNGSGPGDLVSSDGLVTLTMAQLDAYFLDAVAIH